MLTTPETVELSRREALWHAVDRLVDSAASTFDLRAHRIHLLGARRLRARGLPVPDELVGAERNAAFTTLAVPGVLERVREACDGPLVLMKGYEAALRYPDPALRPFVDIDLLTDDPEGISRVLVAAGFIPTGRPDAYYRRRHHVRPLVHPEMPIEIELHRRPPWLQWARVPPARTLIDAAVPSRSGIDGLLALSPAHHALVLLAHSWGVMPLRRLQDMIDTAAVALEAEPGEVEHWAHAWGLGGVWALTVGVHEALFSAAPPPAAARRWAPSLLEVRDPTIIERHKRKLLVPFAVFPPHRALVQFAREVVRVLSPSPGEAWSTKLRRTVVALRHPLTPMTAHRRAFEERRRRSPG
jgi:hypothetical protein